MAIIDTPQSDQRYPDGSVNKGYAQYYLQKFGLDSNDQRNIYNVTNAISDYEQYGKRLPTEEELKSYAQSPDLAKLKNTLQSSSSLGVDGQPSWFTDWANKNPQYNPKALPDWFNKATEGFAKKTDLGQFTQADWDKFNAGNVTAIGGINRQLGDFTGTLNKITTNQITPAQIAAIIAHANAGQPVPLNAQDVQNIVAPLIASGKFDPNSPDFTTKMSTIVSGVLAQQPKVPPGLTSDEVDAIMRTNFGKFTSKVASDNMDFIKTALPQMYAEQQQYEDTMFPGRRAAREGLTAYADAQTSRLGQIPGQAMGDVQGLMGQFYPGFGDFQSKLSGIAGQDITDAMSGQLPPDVLANFLENERSAQGVRGLSASPQMAFQEALGRTGLQEQFRGSRLGEAQGILGSLGQGAQGSLGYGLGLYGAGQNARNQTLSNIAGILGIPLPNMPGALNAPDFSQLSGLGLGMGNLGVGAGNLGVGARYLDLANRKYNTDVTNFNEGRTSGQSGGGFLGGLGSTFLGGLGSFLGPLGALGGSALGSWLFPQSESDTSHNRNLW